MNNVTEVNIGLLSYTLEKTVSADKNELVASQQYLEKELQTNPCEFLKALSDVLANPANSPVARMAAALQIKNAVTAKDQIEKHTRECRWKSFPGAHKDYIKNNILKSIGTETSRPSSAAQCVAAIACIDLSNWPNVIEILCANVVNDTSSEAAKEASLEAIGYICQDAGDAELKEFSNNILTAIIHGMRKETTNKYIRMAATTALMNSLEFTSGNFENEAERNFIMEVVCETTQCADVPIRVAALQSLVKIMSLYYHYMEPYMAQALFPITLEAMKSDVEEIALQGIEFWSNVSDEEVDLSIEETEAADSGQPPPRTSRYYAKGALQYLVPILMQKLTQQEESDDDDDWNPCKAASVCLMLLSSCCEDSILPHVLPFVKEHIKNPDWRYRDAALMAFGAILSGLNPAMLNGLVETAIPTIIELMYDRSVVVRDTAAWTIGRICEMTPETAIRDTHLAALLEAMVTGLKGEPRVAANVCWAFTGLAEASYEAAITQENTEHPSTYCLSPYFDLLMENLLETTNRNDTSQANLRSAAYEALMEMIKNSPRDCYATVQRMTLIILERLNQVLMLEGQVQNVSDLAQVTNLQGLLCATLQSVLRKVTPEDVPKISDQVMTALLQMFRSNSGQAGGVQEDAMLAVTTLVQVMGEGFIKYMESFVPFLFLGLKNHAEYQVCLATVGVVADLCRELKTAIIPYCDDIMTLLLQNLSDNNVHRSVKPQIISLFGDLALAIGPVFDKYLDVVLAMLVQAAKTQVDRSEFDMVDYLNELRESILDAYTGMVQGLGNSNAKVEAQLPQIIVCITDWGLDEDLTDAARCTLIGLLGDVCATFGPKIVPMTNFDLINRILTKAKRGSRLSKTKSHAQWATKEIRKLIKPPS